MQLNSMQWLGLLINTQIISMCCMRLAENATLPAAKLLAFIVLHGRSALCVSAQRAAVYWLCRADVVHLLPVGLLQACRCASFASPPAF